MIKSLSLQEKMLTMPRNERLAKYGQPKAEVISWRCAQGDHKSCTKLDCGCPCGHPVGGSNGQG